MCESTIEAKALLDSLNTAIVVTDHGLVIEYVNDAGLTLFETGYNQLHRQPLAEFLLPNVIESLPLRDAIDGGEDFSETEVKLIFKDNRHVLVDVTVTNMLQSEKPLLMFEFKVIDKQKQIYRETQQYAQHFAARELIRGLAHEIKNPLGGIRGAAQLLGKELVSDQQEFTQLIIEQCDRLRNLVDKLLGPNSLPNQDSHNIHQAIEQVRVLMQADVGEFIELERDYDPSIPPVWIDNDMIQQAVLNIVRNSVQALRDAGTSKPKIKLITRIDRQVIIHGERYPLVAKIKIIDNGPGIPTDIKDTLFYPMVSSKETGSGLGLSIAQTLIHHHKGKIEVESHPGHTAFIICLPILKQELSE